MNKDYNENREGNIISALLFRYLPYWPLFVVLLIIALGTAWGYIQTTTPLYQSSASILLKDNKKGANDGGVEDELNILTGSKVVDNEIELLKSAKLMTEIVADLHLYASTFELGKFKSTSAYLTSPIAVLAKNPEAIKPTAAVPFSVSDKNELLIENKAYPLDQWVTTPYGELRFIKNPYYSRKATMPLVFSLRPVRNVAYSFVGRLQISPTSKSSTVVDVSIKDEVPERGEAVLNKLAEVYNRNSIDEKNKMAVNTLSFVEARLRSVEHELDSLEGSIQRYRTQKGVVNLSDQSRLFLQNVGEYDRKLSEVNLKMSV
jgi:uncharacterized protein involved in exopolysaccharide biosynthesis